MANKFATNFAVPGTSNVFQVVWKLTRVMKAAGWLVMASSDGAGGSKDTSGTQSNDRWGGNADPLTDTYPPNNLADNTAGWIVLRGPSTLKMPLNANPSGTLIRGEVITQATSGAEGELLGYVWDSGGGTGWAVIMPHTGSFDMTHTVTGVSSGATFVPKAAGTLVTYQREVMLSKTTAASTVIGQIFYIVADDVAESAQLWSTLAGSAGCTTTVPPGGGGTGNGWPAAGVLVRGTRTVATNGNWFTAASSFVATSNAQIACVNATPGASLTADGSFYVALSYTGSANGCCGIVFTRLDDTEPGDCDPYAWFCPNNSALTTWDNSTTSVTGSAGTFTSVSNVLGPASSYIGYTARGCPVSARDTAAVWGGSGVLSVGGAGNYNTANNFANSANRKINNHPSATPPQLREPITLSTFSPNAVPSVQSVKGRTRWMQYLTIGTTYDTYDAKTWLVVSVAASATPAIIVGPYDGTTTPTQ